MRQVQLGERRVEQLPLTTDNVNSNLEPVDRVDPGLDAGEARVNVRDNNV
jgi:hypothetical protein